MLPWIKKKLRVNPIKTVSQIQLQPLLASQFSPFWGSLSQVTALPQQLPFQFSLVLHSLRRQIQKNPRILFLNTTSLLFAKCGPQALLLQGSKLCPQTLPFSEIHASFHDTSKTNFNVMRLIQVLLTHVKCAASHNLFSTQVPLRQRKAVAIWLHVLYKYLTPVCNRALSL